MDLTPTLIIAVLSVHVFVPFHAKILEMTVDPSQRHPKISLSDPKSHSTHGMDYYWNNAQ